MPYFFFFSFFQVFFYFVSFFLFLYQILSYFFIHFAQFHLSCFFFFPILPYFALNTLVVLSCCILFIIPPFSNVILCPFAITFSFSVVFNYFSFLCVIIFCYTSHSSLSPVIILYFPIYIFPIHMCCISHILGITLQLQF